MNVLILAAGYATRLYPLTSNKAKPLLDVAGKPMVEWVVENLRGVAEIETIYIVTNAKFFADFETWAKNYQSANPQFRSAFFFACVMSSESEFSTQTLLPQPERE